MPAYNTSETLINYPGDFANDFQTHTLVDKQYVDDKEFVYLTCGEDIPSFTPLSVIGGLVYRANALNDFHFESYVGFSTTSGMTGAILKIKISGILELPGWGLIPDRTYMVGLNGALVLSDPGTFSFKQVVAYSITDSKINILHYSPIKT